MTVSWSPDIKGTWYELYKNEVLRCVRCSARKDCTRPVPGEGDIQADVVFVGRNPGKTEDQSGRPFVGKAGEVFEQMLMEYEWERHQIFVTNLFLCHTKGNRQPSLDEVRTCVPKFLLWSLMEIKPKVVVTFGVCTNYYMNSLKKVSDVHGKRFYNDHYGFYVVPSIHPAAVCYGKTPFVMMKRVMDVVNHILIKEQKG